MIPVGVLQAILQLKDDMSGALKNAVKGVKSTIDSLKGGFKSFADDLKGRMQDLAGSLGPVGKALAALGPIGIAVGAAIGAVALGVKGLVEMSDRLINLARVTQISTDALQRMEAFGRPLGITLEQMTSASTKLEKSLGEGGKGVNSALKVLGLSMDALTRMRPDERLLAVATAIARLEHPLDQAVVGSELLGKSWADLRLNTANIEEGNQAVKDTVLVTKEALDAGNALGSAWGQLWTNMKNAAVENSSPIAQALTSIVNAANSAVQSINETNARSESIVAVRQEMERLAGGSLKLQGLVSGGQSTKAELDALREQAELNLENLRITALVKNAMAEADAARITSTKARVQVERELTAEEKREIEKLAALAKKAAADQLKEIVRVSEAHAKAAGEAWEFWDEAYRKIAEEAEATAARTREAHAKAAGEAWEFWNDALQKIEADRLAADVESATNAMGPGGFSGTEEKRKKQTLALAEAQQAYDDSLRRGADMMQLLGDAADSELGQMIMLTFQADAAVKQFQLGLEQIKSGDYFDGIISGISGAIGAFQAMNKATGSGGTGISTAKGAMTGARIGGAIVPGWGHAIGAAIGGAIGFFRARGRANAIKAISDEVGVTIDEAMLKVIRDSKKNAQTFIADIFGQAFAEGKGDVNRLAEEMADVLSFFERGDITESEALETLGASLPLLIEHWEELGATGREQIQRLISGAQEMGIEFEGLEELIVKAMDPEHLQAIIDRLGVTNAAAQELGISLGALQEAVKGLFAPETLETMAENFGKTTEEMRQIAADLGLNVQTELERAAANIGLTVEDFKALGAAFESATGIDASKLSDFLKQSGITAAELAASLGIDVSTSLGTVNEEAGNAATELGLGADEAFRMANELERASRAAANIHVGGIAGFDSAIPVTGAQHGFHGDVVGPRGFFIEPGKHERVDIWPGGGGGGGLNVTVNIDARGAIGLDKEALVHEVTKGIERNLAGSETRLRRKLQT